MTEYPGWVSQELNPSYGLGRLTDRHATAHFHKTHHPIIEGYDPPEGWGWCFVDEVFIELDHPTKQVGPIKRWV